MYKKNNSPDAMANYRIERDSLGAVKVPEKKLWGAQTQRSLEYFSIGSYLMPREMIPAYAIVKKACALVNHKQGRLSKEKRDLICAVCDEILENKHDDQFPLHVWMTGSGTQFNMNVNEVIANRGSQIKGKPLGSKIPLHPNDDVNMSQSSNDSFPTAMHIATAIGIKKRLIPALEFLKSGIETKVKAWKRIVKLGRTHLQDATPLTLGQEFSAYVSDLETDLVHLKETLKEAYNLTLGGTAVGTGLNTIEGFDKAVAQEIARITQLPFKTAKNKFAAQSTHNALVHVSCSLKSIATTLFKMANDIRLLACGPRAGIGELIIPSNEPGSSIMPGKVNPTQCEALTMLAIQVMANDVGISFASASGYLELNVYKPLIIENLMQSINILSDGCTNFNLFLIKGMKPNLKTIKNDLENSVMLVTALAPLIGYDKASEIAHYAIHHGLTLKAAALKLKYVTEKQFDDAVDPLSMCYPTRKRKNPSPKQKKG
jgi:fumarate hydratase class II